MFEQEEFDYFGLTDGEYRDFMQYHNENPHVYDLFKRFTLEIVSKGFKNFGAMGIIQRIRWETYTDDRFEPLKINNNYSPGYARLFMKDYPQHDGFFRLRALKAETNKAV